MAGFDIRDIDGKEAVSCAASQSGIRPFTFFPRTVVGAMLCRLASRIAWCFSIHAGFESDPLPIYVVKTGHSVMLPL